jgi:hypothetical protein
MMKKGSRQSLHDVPARTFHPHKRHLVQRLHDYQWQIVLTLLTVSLALGYIGFYKFNQATGGRRSLTDLLYLTLQLATIESGAVSGPVSIELEVARLLVPLATAYTTVLAVTTLFRKQLQMVRLWLLRGHIVICGLGEKGWLLANRLKQAGHEVVIIEKAPGNSRNELCREEGIIVMEGDATEPLKLKRAGLIRASHLVSICGNDSINVEVAMAARELCSTRKKGVLSCVVHIINPDLCTLLRECEFGLETFPTFRLEMFNIYERGARILINESSPFSNVDEDAQSAQHILVVGLGRFGESLIVEIARRWYETDNRKNGLLAISLVDQNAAEKADSLSNRYTRLPECCELIPYPMDLTNPQFQLVDTLCQAKLIFICVSDQILGLQTALRLRQLLDHNQPPIVVRMQEDSGLARLLISQDEHEVTFHHIVPFGLLQRTCSPELVLGGMHEILAQAVHEDYLKNRLKEGFQWRQKRSMIPWTELPEDLRESNRRQVDRIRMKLKAAGYGIKPIFDWEAAGFQFTTEEVESMAKMEHDYWMQERTQNGWQFAPGPEDSGKKTHPDLRPWDNLPESIKDKDRQPVIKLPALLARAGFQVDRIENL